LLFEVSAPAQTTVQLVASIKPTNPSSGAGFGDAVALSEDGQTLVVGARSESISVPADDRSAATLLEYSGAVHVFHRTANSWEPQSHFIAESVSSEDSFGSDVAINGDGTLLAVAAIGNDSAASGIDGDANDNSVSGAGAVYLFRRDSPKQWTQVAFLKAARPAEQDVFGVSVDVDASGQIVAVGVAGQDDGAENSGAVYVFGRDSSGQWTQQALLKAPEPRRGERFGIALALSANARVLAVGASQDEQTRGADVGAGVVYLFTSMPAGQWVSSAVISAAQARAGDGFGRGIAINALGDVIAVAASAAPNTAPNAGAVYLFRGRPDASWRLITQIPAPRNDAELFGTSLDLDARGELLIVGASQDGTAGYGAGGAYVFRAGSDARWSGATFLSPPKEGWFGHSSLMSADGALFIVGAPAEAGVSEDQATELDGAGAVHVFREAAAAAP
jgi:hypothetical protein